MQRFEEPQFDPPPALKRICEFLSCLVAIFVQSYDSLICQRELGYVCCALLFCPNVFLCIRRLRPLFTATLKTPRVADLQRFLSNRNSTEDKWLFWCFDCRYLTSSSRVLFSKTFHFLFVSNFVLVISSVLSLKVSNMSTQAINDFATTLQVLSSSPNLSNSQSEAVLESIEGVNQFVSNTTNVTVS